MWIEIAEGICLIVGAVFMLVAAIGLLRLSDFYLRLHAPTKAVTLGLMFTLVGIVLAMPEARVVTKVVLVIVWISVTAPVGAHILSRAAYRNRVVSPAHEHDEYAAAAAARRPDVSPAEDLDGGR